VSRWAAPVYLDNLAAAPSAATLLAAQLDAFRAHPAALHRGASDLGIPLHNAYDRVDSRRPYFDPPGRFRRPRLGTPLIGRGGRRTWFLTSRRWATAGAPAAAHGLAERRRG
jgi:hypothetical protein